MQVHVSGQQFIFPAQCVCCSAAAQTAIEITASKSTGKRVVHTTSKSWAVPYCVNCAEHVKAANTANIIATLVIVVTVFISVCLFLSSSASAACVNGLVGMAISAITKYLLMTKATSMCSPSCACTVCAVSYAGWQGSCHMFDIRSQVYAISFMIANKRKLVDVSPKFGNGYRQMRTCRNRDRHKSLDGA